MREVALEMLLDYNRWATQVLLDDAAQLTQEQFHHALPIGPGSVHATLRHIIGAMARWADRIGQRTLRPSIETDRRYRVAELKDLLTATHAELRAVAEEVDARGGWRETFEAAFAGLGTYRFSYAAAMTHALTHGTHHRAQVLNMRRQLGLPPLSIDLAVIDWECIQTGQIKR